MLVQDSSIAPMLCIQPAGYSTFFPSTLQLHHVVPSVYSPRLSIMLGNAFLSSQAPAYRHNPPYCSTVTSPRHIHHLPSPSFPTTYTYRHQPPPPPAFSYPRPSPCLSSVFICCHRQPTTFTSTPVFFPTIHHHLCHRRLRLHQLYNPATMSTYRLPEDRYSRVSILV